MEIVNGGFDPFHQGHHAAAPVQTVHSTVSQRKVIVRCLRAEQDIVAGTSRCRRLVWGTERAHVAEGAPATHAGSKFRRDRCVNSSYALRVTAHEWKISQNGREVVTIKPQEQLPQNDTDTARCCRKSKSSSCLSNGPIVPCTSS